jgi:glutamate formiminotransferase
MLFGVTAKVRYRIQIQIQSILFKDEAIICLTIAQYNTCILFRTCNISKKEKNRYTVDIQLQIYSLTQRQIEKVL